jgi:acyl-CoA synthetase (AMP-forming)/AMP-acid ligase II
MNLASLLLERAQKHPERPALVDGSRVVSYGELARRVSAGAAALQEMGLSRGQVILVFQPVSIELYEFLLAAFHAGLRVMLADPSAGREFLALCCKRLPPDALFGSWKAQCLRLSVSEMRAIRISICSGGWFPGTRAWRTNDAGGPPIDLTDGEAALVTFTSGSTGQPKAAVRSHGFLLAQHRALAKALEFEEGEVDLITLPVFVLANLASGLTSVLAETDLAKPGSPDVAAVAAQCGKFRVTRCAASPAFFEALLKAKTEMPHFEKIYTGGAPVFPDLLRRLQQTLLAAHIHSVYGSTEAEPIAHFPADAANEETDSLTRRGAGLCSGVPVPEIDLRIISDHWGAPLGPLTEMDFFALAVESGQAGEIVVSGHHVLRGYLGGVGDEETKIHVEGRVWHRTGDAGWIDPSGRVWLLGRCAEKLAPFPAAQGIPRDAPRYPFAIECALREIFPNTRMAAIDWEDQRTLIVGKKCGADESKLIEAKAKDLGIGRVIHLESLPLDRRHNAKIDYPALRVALQKMKCEP